MLVCHEKTPNAVGHQNSSCWYCELTALVVTGILSNIVALQHFRYFVLVFCLNATDPKISQLIWQGAWGRCNDDLIRLGALHISIPFRDTLCFLLASAWNTEYPLTLCRMRLKACWVSVDEGQFWKFFGSSPGFELLISF